MYYCKSRWIEKKKKKSCILSYTQIYFCLWVKSPVRTRILVLKVEAGYPLLSWYLLFLQFHFSWGEQEGEFFEKVRYYLKSTLHGQVFYYFVQPSSWIFWQAHTNNGSSVNSCSDTQSSALHEISSAEVSAYNSLDFNWEAGPGFDPFLELVQLFPLWPTM